MSTLDYSLLAKKSYYSYGNRTNFKNFMGNPMPKWDDLTPEIKEAWKEAVLCCVGEFNLFLMNEKV